MADGANTNNEEVENVPGPVVDNAASVAQPAADAEVAAGADVEMPAADDVEKPAPRRKKSEGRAAEKDPAPDADASDAANTSDDQPERAFSRRRKGKGKAPAADPEPEPAAAHTAKGKRRASANNAQTSDRRAERERDAARRQAVAEAARAAANEARVPPCLPCVRSALAGLSTGMCYQSNGGGNRYDRCQPGGSCIPVPRDALPVVFFFLDYIQEGGDEKAEKNKRRVAAKVVLRGCTDGSFPRAGDPRLRE